MPDYNDDLFLDKINASESETYSFELMDKSKIRSIHYINGGIHFCPNSYENFMKSSFFNKKFGKEIF